MLKLLPASAVLIAMCALIAACSLSSQDPYPPFTELVKLTASDALDDDEFGYAAAIDGNLAVVGAHYKDGAGSFRGAAYVFDRNRGGSDNWGQAAAITAADIDNGDRFGGAVDTCGNDVIIGAEGEDGAGTDRGAAYLFSRHTGGADSWGQMKKLTASDAGDGDAFGCATALDGDTAVVGAYREGEAGPLAGAAYIFSRHQGGPDNWGEVCKLTGSDIDDDDYFGRSVAVSGDIVVVGAPLRTVTLMGDGAAYVFYRDQGGADNWGQVAVLHAGDPDNWRAFGSTVAVSGDLILIGAPGGEGAAYIFHRNQGGADNWGQVKKLTALDGEATDNFGGAAALAGACAVIGASTEDGDGTGRGAVYAFSRNKGGPDNWGQVKKLTASDTEDDDEFGTSVGVSADFIIAGSYGEDEAGQESGAAYIFSGE